MDTELKKLKRVQLLQIMIELSEDCDALIAENAELRKQLERASRKSAMSSTMKVGSIAEAALQANGFFESAQNAADDYLREIKRMRDQVAARTQSQPDRQPQHHTPSQAGGGQAAPSSQRAAMAQRVPQVRASRQEGGSQLAQEQQQLEQQQAQFQQQQLAYQEQLERQKSAAVQEAREMSDRILARANAQAKSIVEDAKVRSETIIAEANRKSHAIVSKANHQAESLLRSAKAKAASFEGQSFAGAAAPVSPQAGAASAQQQIGARQAEPPMSPSSTAEIKIRARHVRAGGDEGLL